jgi:hypothetical protein
MTIEPLLPLLKLLEQLFVENYALRATLGDLDGWDDSTVDGHKEKAQQVFAQRFAAVYRLANNPVELNAALENILRAKKPN